MGPSASVLNALTFDIEDWYHLLDGRFGARSSDWAHRPSIVPAAVDTILELLADARLKATFFMVGWVAERNSGLAMRIRQAGHEVASHSYWHRPVDMISEKVFVEDLQRSVKILEHQTGHKVTGFRAPGFCSRPLTESAVDAMRQLGLMYDSSLVCTPRSWHKHAVFGSPGVGVSSVDGNGFRELPLCILGAGPFALPFSGGGYFRLCPEGLIRSGIRILNRRGIPAVIYLHPRDLLTSPECASMSRWWRWRTRVGVGATAEKLRRLLETHAFGSCEQVLGIATELHVAGAPT